MNDQPAICLTCMSRVCEKSEDHKFDICNYGIPFLNVNGVIEKRNPHFSLINISRNLRHELNPLLQTIIDNASKLDPSISVKNIDVENPVSVIVGASVIIDNFIQMITGTHEFRFDLNEISSNKSYCLIQVIDNYFNTYSILKDNHRANNLKIQNTVNSNINFSFCGEFINYILAVLIDNIWKYSITGSTITIANTTPQDNKINLKFTNISKSFPDNLDIFFMGVKANEDSKGYGYGLHWAKILEHYYNDANNKLDINNTYSSDSFQITHKQSNHVNVGYSIQEFYLNNLIID